MTTNFESIMRAKMAEAAQDYLHQLLSQKPTAQELLNALREDILIRLRSTGTKVVFARDEADGGFTYDYAAGDSVGSISVKAPVHEPEVHRQLQLGPGLDDISVDIALQETWTRPASETKWWMPAVE